MTELTDPTDTEPAPRRFAPTGGSLLRLAGVAGLGFGLMAAMATQTAAQSFSEFEAEESVVEERVENPVAVFSGLDKITGRTTTFDAYIDETVQFGALQITPRVCLTSPEGEAQDTDGFVQVDEITLQREIQRIFSGWMFADSPGLNAVEHPVYDVWLTSCKTDSDVPAPSG